MPEIELPAVRCAVEPETTDIEPPVRSTAARAHLSIEKLRKPIGARLAGMRPA